MSGPIIVLCELGSGEAAGGIIRVSLEAVALARGIGGSAVEALVVGPEAAATAAELGRHGVATIHALTSPGIAGTYAPAAWGSALAKLASARGAAAVVGPGTERGAEVMAHAAARLGMPLAANVLAVAPRPDAGPWSLTRQRWAGSLLEDATLDAPIACFTVAAHAVAATEPGVGHGPAAVVPFDPPIDIADLVVRVTGHEPLAAGSVSLSDARVVVGGGRGVGSAEAFSELEELAGLLGAAVGVSRVVTSNGWRPHTQQVGQTGQRIAPEIYIACGISGAIQHIVGCRSAKRILAINTDPEAPIMTVADYAVIGDLHQVVPAISAEIRRRA